HAEPPATKCSAASNGQVVYLAAPADELRDAWQRVANDLAGAGYIVLPTEGRLPDTAAKAEGAICDALSNAVLAVHFLGESEGGKPDGSEETITRLQLRLTRTFNRAGGRVPCVLWAPKWLPDRRVGKRDPFEVVNRFEGSSPGEQIYAEEVTDLSQWLRARLSPHKPACGSALPRLLVASAV